jgi:chemotaxis protein MotB
MRKPHAPARAGHDRWLVSYADLVTLLLAFFTTLYAASNLDSSKVAPLSASLQDAFAIESAAAPSDGHPMPIEVAPRRHTLDDIKLTLDRQLAQDVQNHDADVSVDPRGLVVSMPDDAAFPVGSTDVSPAALGTIGRIAETVRALPNPIRIEGHTDDVPIRTSRYGSNWELSTARASAVVAYLIEHVGIAPTRLSAAGYGEFHPRVANDSPGNRARNRRIDIIILEDAQANAASGVLISPTPQRGAASTAGER